MKPYRFSYAGISIFVIVLIYFKQERNAHIVKNATGLTNSVKLNTTVRKSIIWLFIHP